MTLFELLDTNGNCSLLTVYVRGTKDSVGQLVQKYRFGKRAKLYAFEHEGIAKTKNFVTDYVLLSKKPIHAQDDGGASYQIGLVKKNIPSCLLNATVTHWNCSKEYSNEIRDGLEFSVDVESGIELETETVKKAISYAEERTREFNEPKIDFGD